MIEGRLGWNEYFMNIAVQVSLRSTCIRRKVGALLVKDNTIISTGYNGAPKGLTNCSSEPNRCYRSAHNIPSGEKLDMCYAQHAEINALLNAIKAGVDLKGSSVYVTTFPCCTCAKALIQAGVKHIYYLDEYTNEFTLSMLEEAKVEATSMDSSIYKTPEIPGAESIAMNDLNSIDPLVAKIYRYKPGTKEFMVNRDKIFKENDLYLRYDETIMATKWHPEKEIIDIQRIWTDDVLFDEKNRDYKSLDAVVEPIFMKRHELEYNGSSIKQFVVAGVIIDHNMRQMLLLESISGRLKGKYTMVQGHVALDNHGMFLYPSYRPDDSIVRKLLDVNMAKEMEEEIGVNTNDLSNEKLRYFIQMNDNKISEEHIGAIYTFNADFDELKSKGMQSMEPEKHRLVSIPLNKLKTPEIYNKMDTWLKKVVDHLIVEL